jgi:hypothetical protein
MTALGILAVITAWVVDAWSGFAKWLDAPADNLMVLVVIYLMYRNAKSMDAQLRTLGKWQDRSGGGS